MATTHRYELRDDYEFYHENPRWTGTARPTQADVDTACEAATTRVLDLYCDGVRVDTMFHDDYEPGDRSDDWDGPIAENH